MFGTMESASSFFFSSTPINSRLAPQAPRKTFRRRSVNLGHPVRSTWLRWLSLPEKGRNSDPVTFVRLRPRELKAGHEFKMLTNPVLVSLGQSIMLRVLRFGRGMLMFSQSTSNNTGWRSRKSRDLPTPRLLAWGCVQGLNPSISGAPCQLLLRIQCWPTDLRALGSAAKCLPVLCLSAHPNITASASLGWGAQHWHFHLLFWHWWRRAISSSWSKHAEDPGSHHPSASCSLPGSNSQRWKAEYQFGMLRCLCVRSRSIRLLEHSLTNV